MSAHPKLADLQDEGTWLERRALIPAPLASSGLVTTEDSRREFLEGARLLRLDQVKNYAGEQIGPTPIQLAVADTLAAGRKLNGILEPRRSGKTSGIQAVLLGRCSLREDYLVGWTLATTGAKAAERFLKDMVAPLERLYPNKASRPMQIKLGKGDLGLHWASRGCFWNVYSPNGDGFRSNAFDAAWVDEGGEAEVELGEDLTAAIRPTLHTRQGAQFIVSGTAPRYRQGNLLWDALVDPTAAVLRHGVPDDVDPEELSSWEPEPDPATAELGRGHVRELVVAAHPGIGWTTPLEAIESDFHAPAMRRTFPAEILGVAGSEGSNLPLLSQPRWADATLPAGREGTEAPRRMVLVAVVHPDATSASIGTAWMGKAGKVRVGLLHHQTGVEGFRKQLLALSRKHRKAIVYDPFGAATAAELVALREARPAPAEKPVIMRDVQRAAVNFANLLNGGKLEHFDQPELTRAVEIAVKREIGGGWGFGRPDVKRRAEDDITPLEAVALAAYLLPAERDAAAEVEITWA